MSRAGDRRDRKPEEERPPVSTGKEKDGGAGQGRRKVLLSLATSWASGWLRPSPDRPRGLSRHRGEDRLSASPGFGGFTFISFVTSSGIPRK